MKNEISSLVSSLISDKKVSLSVANALISCVQQEARRLGVNAVVAVSSPEGRPIAVQCMDNSYIASYDIAVNKAFTSVALKMSTAKLKNLAQPGQSLYGIQFTNEGKIVIFGGGVPLYNNEGNIIGGLGVSGGTEEQDTALAQFGGKLFASAFKNIRKDKQQWI